MKYILINGKKSTIADSDEKFVKWMRKCDAQIWKNNQDFMKGYSHRKKLFENIELCPESEEAFVKDLIKNNLLQIEDKNFVLMKLLKKGGLKFSFSLW